jgi:ubiquinone/menaquinone biosynthesis C-methylase UbiE
MGLFDRFVWAPLLDFVMRQEPIMRQRAKVVPRARGRVLEIGIGSGLNLGVYDRAHVGTLCGLEPSEGLRTRAAARARQLGIALDFVGLDGQDIPAADHTFDTVVTTFTLCSIPDASRALREMRRVLRPDGQLLFAEHGVAPDASVARWQHRLNGAWRTLAGGCNMNRDIPALIRGAGFRPTELDALYLPGPKVLTYNYWGVAVPVG